jgi:hypothetical protein
LISPGIATAPNRKAEAGLPRLLAKRQALIKTNFRDDILIIVLIIVLIIFYSIPPPALCPGAAAPPGSNGQGAFLGAFLGLCRSFFPGGLGRMKKVNT